MTVTASRTGRAFLVSALTVVAGIVVVATSPMPMLRDFGIVMALNVTVALLSALVVLPPVLVWAEESHGWISRGLLRAAPDPIEFKNVVEVRPEFEAPADERSGENQGEDTLGSKPSGHEVVFYELGRHFRKQSEFVAASNDQCRSMT